jgi:predicted MPP superfamily phosphohydrolase
LNPSVVRLTLWILAALAICLALGLHSGPPEVRKWSIKDSQLPALKIALFSDFHFSSAADLELLATLKRQLINEDPDIVLFAGDYIGSHAIYKTTSRATIVKSLEALAYPKLAFAVLGNHDNWDSNEAWHKAFDGSSIQLIDNRVVTATINETSLCIRGLGDIYSDRWEYVGIPENCQERAITLTHDPAGLLTLTGNIETVSFAGHTHCGQIVFPLIGTPIVPTRAPNDMHCGLYTRGKTGLTSGGLGSSIIPARFGPLTAPGWELISIISAN